MHNLITHNFCSALTKFRTPSHFFSDYRFIYFLHYWWKMCCTHNSPDWNWDRNTPMRPISYTPWTVVTVHYQHRIICPKYLICSLHGNTTWTAFACIFQNQTCLCIVYHKQSPGIKDCQWCIEVLRKCSKRTDFGVQGSSWIFTKSKFMQMG